MFEKICRMSQKDLKKFVTKKLEETHDIVIAEDGFVFAQGDFPVLLVAHLDTVHKSLPRVIHYNKKTDSLSSPQGIGGDDRCGVYMVLEAVKQFNCSVLFCEDEEVGGVGAEKFTKSDLAQSLEFNYMIEFDRRGKNDAVFYECDNVDFTNFITEEFYKTAWGSFSDISILAPFFGCAAVNLSCGYYNAHTTQEYVVLSEMEQSLDMALRILAKTSDEDVFEYVSAWDEYEFDNFEKTYYVTWYAEYEPYSGWEEVKAKSKEEAVGKFLMAHTNLTYDDIDVMGGRDAFWY